jgi:hypothetical protein
MCYWRGEVQMHRGIYITNLNLLIISHFTFNHTPLVSGNTITINTPNNYCSSKLGKFGSWMLCDIVLMYWVGH